jgi:hypothetical protein
MLYRSTEKVLKILVSDMIPSLTFAALPLFAIRLAVELKEDSSNFTIQPK